MLRHKHMEHGGGSKPSLGDKNKEERRRGGEEKRAKFLTVRLNKIAATFQNL